MKWKNTLSVKQVLTEVKNPTFLINRGVRQENPVSSILFEDCHRGIPDQGKKTKLMELRLII